MELNQTKKLLHSKGKHQQNKKTTHGIGQHIHRYIYKIRKILPFATVWMDPENMLSEISQSEKDKYHMISLICGI